MEISNFQQSLIGEVLPKTKADSELQPMFAGHAPFFAYALLCARLMSLMHDFENPVVFEWIPNLLAIVL